MAHEIDIVLTNTRIQHALVMVANRYETNPDQPFKGDTKYHQDKVRDNLTGGEFVALYHYVQEYANEKRGTNLASLRDWRSLVEDEIADASLSADDPLVFEALTAYAFGNGHGKDLTRWRKAVWGVYSAALTLLHENDEIGKFAKRQVFGSLFE